MLDLLASNSYLTLFLLAFLASTFLPVGSEWLLVTLLLNDYEPLALIATATAGNTLGACTNYWIGIYGGPFLIRRVLRISGTGQERAERLYTRYGSWSLLFSWLPVVGDPLCFVAGLLKVRFTRFSVLVFSGKLVRYAAVAYLTLGGARLFA